MPLVCVRFSWIVTREARPADIHTYTYTHTHIYPHTRARGACIITQSYIKLQVSINIYPRIIIRISTSLVKIFFPKAASLCDISVFKVFTPWGQLIYLQRPLVLWVSFGKYHYEGEPDPVCSKWYACLAKQREHDRRALKGLAKRRKC